MFITKNWSKYVHFSFGFWICVSIFRWFSVWSEFVSFFFCFSFWFGFCVLLFRSFTQLHIFWLVWGRKINAFTLFKMILRVCEKTLNEQNVYTEQRCVDAIPIPCPMNHDKIHQNRRVSKIKSLASGSWETETKTQKCQWKWHKKRKQS